MKYIVYVKDLMKYTCRLKKMKKEGFVRPEKSSWKTHQILKVENVLNYFEYSKVKLKKHSLAI